MGKNSKKGGPNPKSNVFKIAGAKSLKKTKAKPVNLGLKNIKQKVQDIDKQFAEINKNPKKQMGKVNINLPEKESKKPKITKEDVANTADRIVKMDL